MPEGMNYVPEEVIQQEGPNKGAIKDLELARVGAEAEDKARNENTMRYYSKDVENAAMDRAGSVAIQEEVNKRAYEAQGVDKYDYDAVYAAKSEAGRVQGQVMEQMGQHPLNIPESERAAKEAELAEVRGKINNL